MSDPEDDLDSPCDPMCDSFYDADDHDRYHEWDRYWKSLTPTEQHAEHEMMAAYTMETQDEG
jgi:hypothetical protein